MFRETLRNKKTLTNELNVPGSSDNRRLNQDVIPTIAPSWLLAPTTSLPSAVTLGSAQNPWLSVGTENLFAAFPRISRAVMFNFGGSSMSATPPTVTPTNNGGYFWNIEAPNSVSANLRKVWRWTGSAWVDYTSQLTPGAIFTGDFSTACRIYVWTGPRVGSNYGLRESFGANDFA